MIIFWHGELGINSPKLLDRLRTRGIGHGGSEAALSCDKPILQRFSWGPETYAAIVPAAALFLYFISSAHGPDDWPIVVAITGACLVLLLVRIAQRLNRRRIFVLPPERRGHSARVKVTPRFARSSVADLAAVTFEWPHLGYVFMASLYWTIGMSAPLAILALRKDGSLWGSLNPTEVNVVCAILAILCAAMVANIIRTKVLLFRCFIPTGRQDDRWLYVSAHDALRMVVSSETTLVRTCFVDRAGAAVLARTVTDAVWQLERR